MQLTKEQINKAVDWWKEVIANPKFDNGDDSQQGQMGSMLAKMACIPATQEQLTKFEEVLRTRLSSYNPFYCRELDRTFSSHLSVDYHPDPVLREILTDSGIDLSNAPWKTIMYFHDNGQVSVVYGYTASEIIL